jgi:hypothetical protein
MTMRAELPFTIIPAGDIRGAVAGLWDRIATFATDKDFLAVCAVSAAGLAASLGFALAVTAGSGPIELSAVGFGG